MHHGVASLVAEGRVCSARQVSGNHLAFRGFTHAENPLLETAERVICAVLFEKEYDFLTGFEEGCTRYSNLHSVPLSAQEIKPQASIFKSFPDLSGSGSPPPRFAW